MFKLADDNDYKGYSFSMFLLNAFLFLIFFCLFLAFQNRLPILIQNNPVFSISLLYYFIYIVILVFFFLFSPTTKDFKFQVLAFSTYFLIWLPALLILLIKYPSLANSFDFYRLHPL